MKTIVLAVLAVVTLGCGPELRVPRHWERQAEQTGTPCRVVEGLPALPGLTDLPVSELYYCGTRSGDIDRRMADGGPICTKGCRELVMTVAGDGQVGDLRWN